MFFLFLEWETFIKNQCLAPKAALQQLPYAARTPSMGYLHHMFFLPPLSPLLTLVIDGPSHRRGFTAPLSRVDAWDDELQK